MALPWPVICHGTAMVQMAGNPLYRRREKRYYTSISPPKNHTRNKEKQAAYRPNDVANDYNFGRYITEPPAMEELRRVIKKLKRRKAPGLKY